MTRRDLLVRTGLGLSAGMLTALMGENRGLAAPGLVSSLDSWDVVRQQFSLSPHFIHMSCFFLASHPRSVDAAIERHRAGLDADPIGYWFEHSERLEGRVLAAAARYLGVHPTDIALTDSTTMGLGLLYGSLQLEPNQEILTTVHDHYSTDTALRLRAAWTGATVRHMALYRDLATVSREELVETLIEAIRPQTRIIAVTWVHSSTGLKLPIQEMSAAIRRLNAGRDEHQRVLLCVDGVHGLGVEDVTLPELGCDFFVAGTHKWLFGPRGTGLVWGQPAAWPAAHAIIPTFNELAYEIWMNEIPPQPVPIGAIMTPGGFHSFEHRWALDEAFVFHQRMGKPRVQERIRTLNTMLKEGLQSMRHVRLRTPVSAELSAGIVCFELSGWKPEEAVARLRAKRIIASVTPYAVRYIRLAPSLVTSETEVNETIRAIAGMES